MSAGKDMTVEFSIILPVLNEEKNINTILAHLEKIPFDGCFEIIVVDGNPKGNTLACIQNSRVIKLMSSPGRGGQMNDGANQASGDILLFLHADTTLPKGALDAIKKAFCDPGIMAGAFDLSIDHPGTAFRIIEKIASLRSRLTKLPYGDQGIFIRKSFFYRIGQFALIPIMEDVELMQKIKKLGARICILRLQTTTSARRWQTEGLFYCTMRNWILLTLFFWGVPPQTLVKYYRS